MGNRLGLIAALLFVVTNSAGAIASNCDALLAHGAYNIQITKGSSARSASYFKQYCGIDYSQIDKSTHGDIDVNVIGYGGGSGSLSDSDRETRLKQWCNEHKQSSSMSDDTYQEIRAISDSAMHAWESCTKAQEVEYTFNLDSQHQSFVQIQSKYKGAGKGVGYGGIDVVGFSCRVVKFDKLNVEAAPVSTGSEEASGLLDNGGITVNCIRDAPTPITVDGVVFQVYKQGAVSINIAGNSTLVNFNEEKDPVATDVKDLFVPKNAVMAFDSNSACPKGWLPYVDGIGRVLIGQGSASGLQAVGPGETGGANFVKLTMANIPAHTHDMHIMSIGHAILYNPGQAAYPSAGFLGNSPDAAGYYWNMTMVQGAKGQTDVTGAAGTDDPATISVMMPYKSLLYCIKQ